MPKLNWRPLVTIPLAFQDAGFIGRLQGCDARRKPQRYRDIARICNAAARPANVPETSILKGEGYTTLKGLASPFQRQPLLRQMQHAITLTRQFHIVRHDDKRG